MNKDGQHRAVVAIQYVENLIKIMEPQKVANEKPLCDEQANCKGKESEEAVELMEDSPLLAPNGKLRWNHMANEFVQTMAAFQIIRNNCVITGVLDEMVSKGCVRDYQMIKVVSPEISRGSRKSKKKC